MWFLFFIFFLKQYIVCIARIWKSISILNFSDKTRFLNLIFYNFSPLKICCTLLYNCFNVILDNIEFYTMLFVFDFSTWFIVAGETFGQTHFFKFLVVLLFLLLAYNASQMSK